MRAVGRRAARARLSWAHAVGHGGIAAGLLQLQSLDLAPRGVTGERTRRGEESAASADGLAVVTLAREEGRFAIGIAILRLALFLA